MSRQQLTVAYSGKSYAVEGNRPGNGNVEATSFIKTSGGSLLGDMNAALTSLNGLTANVVPFTPAAVANAGTVSLVIQASPEGIQVLRPTSDGTIAGAVINLPTSGIKDGVYCAVVSTGTITTVTGTLASGSVLPAVTTLAAGVALRLRYNATATTWFKV